MAKGQVWTLICHLATIGDIRSTIMHLNYIKRVWHGWQLIPFVIYLMYMTNPQMFICWLHGHEWCPSHPQQIQWYVVILTVYATLLDEVISKYSMLVMVLLHTLCSEDSYLNSQGMYETFKLKPYWWIQIENGNLISHTFLQCSSLQCTSHLHLTLYICIVKQTINLL